MGPPRAGTKDIERPHVVFAIKDKNPKETPLSIMALVVLNCIIPYNSIISLMLIKVGVRSAEMTRRILEIVTPLEDLNKSLKRSLNVIGVVPSRYTHS